MQLSKFFIFLSICLMSLITISASKSLTEITIKPPSSKMLAKLLGIKKPKSKSKLQRKSARLPKMGFLGGNSFLSMMDDHMLTASPRQDFAGLLRGSSRLSSFENSPIYYIRMPPMPYMYSPGLGYVSQASPLTNSLRSETFHGNSVSPFMNLPINFLSNGQPNGALEFGMPELMSSAFPGKSFLRQEPPIFGRRQFFDDSSKLSTLKGQFDFNGRAEGIYMLPESSYYQSSNMF